MTNISFKTIVVFLWSDQACRLKDENVLRSSKLSTHDRPMLWTCQRIKHCTNLVPRAFSLPPSQGKDPGYEVGFVRHPGHGVKGKI